MHVNRLTEESEREAISFGLQDLSSEGGDMEVEQQAHRERVERRDGKKKKFPF